MSNTTTLLDEQQILISGLRRVCSGIINSIETNIINIADESENESNKNRGSVLGIFFKISALLLKLIPLEQQLVGTKLLKNFEAAEKIKNKEEKGHVKITESDIALLRKFIENEPTDMIKAKKKDKK